ncbi:hypothetical protein BE20_24835 [Sorangium cellulosum]|uniref:Uncharacterized protein n=1 Tax=Sorangium cellulosum TaxID=56 RepID=A0A150SA55_SORCE|nr:hypothetical protein BE20_24835 [Sorangium cellulosum]KYF89292.1 hypothetical protein BE18_22935 [Sorangium cellulosum]
MSPLEELLVGALCTGLTGLTGLIVWVVKSVVPKILTTLEDRTKALVLAVEKIPEALDKFEERLAVSEAKILAKIEEKRFEELREELRRRLPSAEDTIPPYSPLSRRSG